ncbi:uncharacterized protein ACBT57_012022 isoform 1-T1 [Dama dama]
MLSVPPMEAEPAARLAPLPEQCSLVLFPCRVPAGPAHLLPSGSTEATATSGLVCDGSRLIAWLLDHQTGVEVLILRQLGRYRREVPCLGAGWLPRKQGFLPPPTLDDMGKQEVLVDHHSAIVFWTGIETKVLKEGKYWRHPGKANPEMKMTTWHLKVTFSARGLKYL